MLAAPFLNMALPCSITNRFCYQLKKRTKVNIMRKNVGV